MRSNTLDARILEFVRNNEGHTDREIAELLDGKGTPQQAVNQRCRLLESLGHLIRKKRHDGLIGNYLAGHSRTKPPNAGRPIAADNRTTKAPMSEDALKAHIQTWLQKQGWNVVIAWGSEPGPDIVATHGDDKWIIEVKGLAESNPQNHNYFVNNLGSLLQKMTDRDARYSVALPAVDQFRNLWKRMPRPAIEKTGITAIFVDEAGHIELAR